MRERENAKKVERKDKVLEKNETSRRSSHCSMLMTYYNYRL